VSAYFFTALDDAAAAAFKGTPYDRIHGAVPLADVDAESSAVEWESLLTGTDPGTLISAGEPRHVGEVHNDGRYVFVLSARLQAQLIAAGSGDLVAVAREWARLRRADGEPLRDNEAERLLELITVVARAAAENGEQVYCTGD
jgi:hypothetical protein